MPVHSARNVLARAVGCAAMVLTLGVSGSSAESARAAVPVLSASGATIIGFSPVSDGPYAATREGLETALRNTFDLIPAIRPLVERMWIASPTFRRQCARLAQGSLTVTVRLDFSPLNTRANAETVITREPRFHARVSLRGAQFEMVQYLAHELEHVLEQIDGVDLPRAVAERVDGARLLGGSAVYETARAIAVGRQVTREVEQQRR
jgi:hypothetical protein